MRFGIFFPGKLHVRASCPSNKLLGRKPNAKPTAAAWPLADGCFLKSGLNSTSQSSDKCTQLRQSCEGGRQHAADGDASPPVVDFILRVGMRAGKHLSSERSDRNNNVAELRWRTRPCIGFRLDSSLCDFMSGRRESQRICPNVDKPDKQTPHPRCCLIGEAPRSHSNAFMPILLVSIHCL